MGWGVGGCVRRFGRWWVEQHKKEGVVRTGTVECVGGRNGWMS